MVIEKIPGQPDRDADTAADRDVGAATDLVPIDDLLKDGEFLEEFDQFMESMKNVDRDMLLFLAFRSISESIELNKEETSFFEDKFSEIFDMLSTLAKEVALLKNKKD